MKKSILFAVLAISLLSTNLSARERPSRLYGFFEGQASYLKQFHEKDMDFNPNRKASSVGYRTEFQGGLTLGMGYEFKEKGFNRLELECGLGHNYEHLDYQSFYADQKNRKLYSQLTLGWTSLINKQLKWVPKIGVGYCYEWVTASSNQLNAHDTGTNTNAPYVSCSPFAMEYKLNDALQVQMVLGEVDLLRLNTDGIEKKYYTFAAYFNKIAARLVFRF